MNLDWGLTSTLQSCGKFTRVKFLNETLARIQKRVDFFVKFIEILRNFQIYLKSSIKLYFSNV